VADEIGEAYSTHGKGEECIDFGEKVEKKEITRKT
jgi:hypothetical protein